MDLREFEAFLAVADELHFGRAAARIHVTTTRVSQSVRALERRVGGPLFERSTRRVRLTPLGEQLRADLDPAYRAMQEALRAARRRTSGSTSVLHLGFATTMSRTISAELIDAFKQRHPNCELRRSAHPAWHMHVHEKPDFGATELFVTWAPTDPEVARAPGWEVGPALRRVNRALVVAQHHPLADRASVDVEELADYDLLYPGGAEPASGRMAGYEDAWTPPATPAGRPLRRVRRLSGGYLEEVLDVVADGELAHVTVDNLLEVHYHRGVAMVSLTGLPPMLCVPIWPTTATNPMIAAFLSG